jgi:pimeloyl-ACP methyl ester carboxylesterase
MIEAPTTFIETNHIRTAQAVVGDGMPVLMLHGWGAHLGLMWPLAERLAPLGYRIHLPDLPGFGQSEPPPTGWSVHEYVGFVVAYMDHHALNAVHLVGHSFGGRLGLVLGAEHPERVSKMALIDSAGVRSKPSLKGQIRQRAYKFARSSLNRVGLKRVSDNLSAWYADRYGSPDYKAAKGVMRETFVKVVNEDLLPYAAKVKPSTLLLWGDQDDDTPLGQGQLLENTIPDAGLVVFEGAGHYSYLDRLEDTVRILDHFFNQTDK